MGKVAQKLHGGWGVRSSGPCRHRFQYLIPVYQLLRYTGYDWSILWQFTSAFTSSSGFTRTESSTDMLNVWNPPSLHLLTNWHFWHKKQFFRKWGEAIVGGLRCLKNANRLSPCVSPPLFPHMLLNRSLAFSLVCADWGPLARQKKKYSYMILLWLAMEINVAIIHFAPTCSRRAICKHTSILTL